MELRVKPLLSCEVPLDKIKLPVFASTKVDGLVPMNTLGSLVLKYGDTDFSCGTGFTDAQRKGIWDNRDKYLGKLASIRYMSVGQKDKPRVPSFIGWRQEDDISE